jgi:hypothetical protein
MKNGGKSRYKINPILFIYMDSQKSVKILTCDRSVVFSGSSVSSNNKTDRHDITEILLKVALNTIKTNKTKQFLQTSVNPCKWTESD